MWGGGCKINGSSAKTLPSSVQPSFSSTVIGVLFFLYLMSSAKQLRSILVFLVPLAFYSATTYAQRIATLSLARLNPVGTSVGTLALFAGGESVRSYAVSSQIDVYNA